MQRIINPRKSIDGVHLSRRQSEAINRRLVEVHLLLKEYLNISTAVEAFLESSNPCSRKMLGYLFTLYPEKVSEYIVPITERLAVERL